MKKKARYLHVVNYSKKKRCFFSLLSPHELKEEIETKHFEHTLRFWGTNRAAEPRLTKTGRGEVLCVSPQPLPLRGIFFVCDEC